MVTKLLSFFNSNNIAIKKANIVVAVSGGIDSVVLAHVCSQAGIDFGVAHCNFNLRGEESDGDEQFVKKLAEKLNIPYFFKSFNTVEHAVRTGVSIQMAARELRYAWFEEIRVKFGYAYIATAHHKGDVAETMLFNLAKGTGLAGLHGINPVIGKLVRPLLFALRKDIIRFAKNNHIEWREDSSNTSVKYSRNKIRHLVIPVLEDINPKAQEAVYNTGKRLKEVEEYVKHSLKKTVDLLMKQQGINTLVNLKSLVKIPGYSFVLYEILKLFKFNYVQTNDIVSALGGVPGKLFYSVSHVVNIDRNTLLISPIATKNHRLFLSDLNKDYQIGNLSVSTKTILASNYILKPINTILALDKSKLSFPLEIRSWQKGDIFYPLGMKGKKKLSDYMIDAKIPVNLKGQIWVVVSEGNIVGILNHRLDDRFKIRKTTQTIFEISCN